MSSTPPRSPSFPFLSLVLVLVLALALALFTWDSSPRFGRILHCFASRLVPLSLPLSLSSCSSSHFIDLLTIVPSPSPGTYLNVAFILSPPRSAHILLRPSCPNFPSTHLPSSPLPSASHAPPALFVADIDKRLPNSLAFSSSAEAASRTAALSPLCVALRSNFKRAHDFMT